MSLAPDQFARAFGDALKAYLDEKGIGYAKAATRLGVRKQTLSTYWTDDIEGKRRKPRAELLFRACMELEFNFEYQGYQVTVDALGKPREPKGAVPEQLRLDYSRQFKLTEDDGEVSLSLKRRPGRVELSVSLKAAS
jgi:transcriptional regulator with XRE-family HTH domain